MLSWTDSRTKRNIVASTNLHILGVWTTSVMTPGSQTTWNKGGERILEKYSLFSSPRPNDLVKSPRKHSFIILIFFLTLTSASHPLHEQSAGWFLAVIIHTYLKQLIMKVLFNF